MKRTFMQKVQREFEVAFSKHAQPIGFRIAKYIVIATLLYFLWGTDLLWIIFSAVIVISLGVHFWYRHKTYGWTKSYGAWDYEKNKPKAERQ